MTEPVEFNVEDGGMPALAGEGEEAPAPEDVSGPALALTAPGWTPEEASALLAGVFNVGVLIWGPEWTAHPAEFRASGTLLAPHLDQWMPKESGGGLATLGVGLIACVGEAAGATARRWPLLKRGPRPVWVPAQAQQPPPDGGAQPAAPSAQPESAPSGESKTVKLPRDLEAVIDRAQRPDASLSVLGL